MTRSVKSPRPCHINDASTKPSGTVRRVIYPVGGGERTLKALAAEAWANEARYPGSGPWPAAW
jgi:hypothetical protein